MADSPASPPTAVFLACFSGPDGGKRVALSPATAVLGRAMACEVLSDDADVAERHVALGLVGGRAAFRAIDGAPVFVDGHRVAEGTIAPQQQLRLGRSIWQIDTGAEDSVFGRIGGHISSAAGVERIEGFSLREMFSDTFRRRTDEDSEEYFTMGTRRTTPPLSEVDASWPRPWAFARIFTISAVVYLGFVMGFREFGNALLVPGLIMVGSIAIPFSILVFFLEMNVPRNVSLYQVIKLLMYGGILSIVLSLFFFRWTGLSSWLGAAAAGIVEEAGKALALLLVVNRLRYPYILNGLLFGAAVGTGFAIFESAGYAFVFGMRGGASAMMDIITLRGLLSVLGGHGLWTGLVGAALWRVRGPGPLRKEMLADPRFLRVLGLVMAMHMVWNSPINLPLHAKHLALGFVAWVAMLSFIQAGLRQVRAEQERLAAAGPATTILERRP